MDHDEFIPVEKYAKELNIRTEELMGYIKTGLYQGENINGYWYVKPNRNAPKSNIGRFLWYLLVPSTLFGIVLFMSDLFSDNFVFVEAATKSLQFMGIISAIGAAAFILAKINQR